MDGLDELRAQRDRLITQGYTPTAIVCSEAGFRDLEASLSKACTRCVHVAPFHTFEGLPIVVLVGHVGPVLQEIAVKP